MNARIPRRVVFGGALMLIAPNTAIAVEPDPIFAAILAVQQASAALTAALDGLNENDPIQMRRADEAADRDAGARNALAKVRPSTRAGFHALIRFHAEDVTWMEPDTFGALALRDLADALDAFTETATPAIPASRHSAMQDPR
ncbi:hypothetical protein FV242_32045 [Methylobacterium sp. WL64]|uniref:hypothetical protein n=1 Tax=Methylobacterium sp. WL64 TaxID=2603894 RepID=UPI0011CB0249|nr:hypothetical protein [Methylobacterium sp. WL64]TXM97253.1 hypothetical protein FV242_32045 [Methylobacterium sp. WL64]